MLAFTRPACVRAGAFRLNNCMLSTQAAEASIHRIHKVLVPLIEKRLDGFKLWFFANKGKLEEKDRVEVCPHHENSDECPSKNDTSHSCPFTKSILAEEALRASWTDEECSSAEVQVAAYKTKAERQLELLEYALGPYARGERNMFSAPLRLTVIQRTVEVDSFDTLLELYHREFSAKYGGKRWGNDREAQKLVHELTANFLLAAEPDFRVEENRE